MEDVLEFLIVLFFFTLLTAGTILVLTAGTILGMGIAADYWNGSARASLIKKQTGIEYTWREAAQMKNTYDRNNVKIIFENDQK